MRTDNTSENIIFVPDSFLVGTRIDKFLSDEREELSRSYIQQLIDDSMVLVNDAKVKPILVSQSIASYIQMINHSFLQFRDS